MFSKQAKSICSELAKYKSSFWTPDVICYFTNISHCTVYAAHEGQSPKLKKIIVIKPGARFLYK